MGWYRRMFPKRKTPWPNGTKRQWRIGAIVLIGLWLLLRCLMVLIWKDDTSLLETYQIGRVDGLLLFGLIILVWTWRIKEQSPTGKREEK